MYTYLGLRFLFFFLSFLSILTRVILRIVNVVRFRYNSGRIFSRRETVRSVRTKRKNKTCGDSYATCRAQKKKRRDRVKSVDQRRRSVRTVITSYEWETTGTFVVVAFFALQSTTYTRREIDRFVFHTCCRRLPGPPPYAREQPRRYVRVYFFSVLFARTS